MNIVVEQFANFLNTLDWMYIFSFILITYVIQYYKLPELISKGIQSILKNKYQVPTIRNRYQVLIIGFIYGVLIFFVRGYDLEKVLNLSLSFFLATTFHKFLLELVFERFFPKKVLDISNDQDLI